MKRVKLFAKFMIVGASGVIVNLVVYTILLTVLNMHHIAAATISFLVAVTNNFYWNFVWTFQGRAEHKSVRRKYIQFFIVSFLNFLVNLAILELIVRNFLYILSLSYKIGIDLNGFDTFCTKYNLDKIIAQFFAIGIASALNFIGNYKITFRNKKNNNSNEFAEETEDENINNNTNV